MLLISAINSRVHVDVFKFLHTVIHFSNYGSTWSGCFLYNTHVLIELLLNSAVNITKVTVCKSSRLHRIRIVPNRIRVKEPTAT